MHVGLVPNGTDSMMVRWARRSAGQTEFLDQWAEGPTNLGAITILSVGGEIWLVGVVAAGVVSVYTAPTEDGARTLIGSFTPSVDLRDATHQRVGIRAAGVSSAINSDAYVVDTNASLFGDGIPDATITAGTYSAGAYGAGVYGEGDVLQALLTEASSWQFDTFGELLMACAQWDGKLYYWDPLTDDAVQITALVGPDPINCVGVVVTPERFVVALGAGGDGRRVWWAAQETLDVWDITDLTQTAGDFYLQTNGRIMCGRRSREETLIWTDEGLHSMRYIGGTLLYGFPELGRGCGIIARNAVAIVDNTRAFWMGEEGFFSYNGSVSPIPCEVLDYVFSDFNKTQKSKVVAVPQQATGEVWWFYPSKDADENDRYVVYNYRESHWTIGTLSRTAGVDRAPFDYPIMADATGAVYEHERGTNYDALVPYAESGPMELGEGGRLMHVQQLLPDENALGDVRLYLYLANAPTEDDGTIGGVIAPLGPFTLTEPTDLRATARQMRVRVEQVTPGWRVGVFRVRAVPGGQR